MDNSPLKKLPAELRILIYEFALYRPEKITLVRQLRRTEGEKRHVRTEIFQPPESCCTCAPMYRDHVFHEKLLTLTTTCKQIRSEAMPVFMAVNQFAAYAEAIPLIKLLGRWMTRLDNVEIALDHRDWRSHTPDTIADLAKRMIKAKKRCTRFGVHASLSVYFAWGGRVSGGSNQRYIGHTLRLDQCSKDAMQRVLDASICKAREAAMSRWPGSPTSKGSLLFSMSREQENMNRLLDALGTDPEWSWTWDGESSLPRIKRSTDRSQRREANGIEDQACSRYRIALAYEGRSDFRVDD